MSRNLFATALMGGLAGFANGRAQEIKEDQEFQRRLQLQDNAQENMLERMGARTGAVGGSGSPARVGAPPAFASPEEERKFRAAAESDEEVAAQVRSEGGQVIKTLDGGYVKNTDQWRDGLERLRQIRQVAAGDKISDVSEAGMDQELTRQQRRAGEGDRTSQEGILVSKGKDPLETAARAEAQEAKADKDKRTDPNIRRSGGGGGGGGSKPARVQSTQTDAQGNLIAVMSDGSTRPLGIKSGALNQRLEPVKKRLSENERGFSKLSAEEQHRRALEAYLGSAAAPAQSPAAPAPAASAPTRKPLTAFVKPNQ